jgi:hypothetical protein
MIGVGLLDTGAVQFIIFGAMLLIIFIALFIMIAR